MKFKVVYTRFWMILGHFRVFENRAKNDPEIAKVEPPPPVKVVTPTILNSQFSRTLKFPRGSVDKLSFDVWWLRYRDTLPLNTLSVNRPRILPVGAP